MELPVVYPMGAKTDDKRLKSAWTSPDWWAERKYDGSRYLMRKEKGEVHFVSRQKSKTTGLPVDKTENVPHLVELFSLFPDNTILDGEIITHENCTSNEVTSIMGSLPDEALRKQQERGGVQFVVFDILYYAGNEFYKLPFRDRRKALEKIFQDHFPKTPYAYLVEIEQVNKKGFNRIVIQNGGEGTILKNINKPYVIDDKKPKKPTNTWIKVKKYMTLDVVVLGYTNPTKEYTGNYPESWSYWENPEGELIEVSSPGFSKDDPNAILTARIAEHDLEDYEEPKIIYTPKDGWTPISKDYYMGWIGAVRFGQWVPDDVYEEKRKDKLIPVSTQTINMDAEGVRYHMVEIGQTDGLSDEWKEKFTNNKAGYISSVIEVGAMEQMLDTLALRHPRFLRLREDKQAKECILGEH